MSCPVNKIDSNTTGLRYAEEECLRELPEFIPAVAASGTLTLANEGLDGNVVVVGAVTYTLVDTLVDPNDVLIGADAAETVANLNSAITLGEVSGITGDGTVPHPAVTSTASGAVLSVSAITAGVAGNTIGTTTDISGGVFSGATLTGGSDAEATDAVWHLLEPNSYSDFGGQITTIARNPINPSRQRKKGVTSDLDASGGFNQDLTLNNTTRLLQGFFFADIREKKTTAPMNGVAIELTGVAGNTYSAANGLEGFGSGSLVFASGFGLSANNGLKTVDGNSTSGSLVVIEALSSEPTPPATAKVETVGRQFAAGAVSIVMNGNLVRLTSGSVDLTTIGLIPGEWVFLGGDSAALRFDNNQGFARVSVVTEGYLEFDKVSWTPEAESGAGKTVRMFFGSVLKNEGDPDLIKRRTYHVERTLGRDADGTMSEYLVGAVPNEFTLNVAQADKVNIDLAFVAVDNEQRTGAQGVKPGVRPALEPADAFNTSSDFARIKLASVNDNAAPQPLFAFATDLTLTINNNVTPNKAIGVLGAFDTSAGTFEVGGSMTAYFADVTAAQAVRNNSDITLDIIMLKRNAGMLFDIPLLSLGDGRLTVEQDQAITIPLETNAAESKFNHTLLFQSFAYLPNLAG